jgi:hypothetical protein
MKKEPKVNFTYKFGVFILHALVEMYLEQKKIHSTVIFCDPLSDSKTRVKITRRQEDEFVISFGRPNSKERSFLKDCKLAKTNPKRFWYNLYKEKKI